MICSAPWENSFFKNYRRNFNHQLLNMLLQLNLSSNWSNQLKFIMKMLQ